METLVGGLIIALLYGLAWLAYKHPNGYAALADRIIIVCFAISSLVSVFFAGYIFGTEQMLAHFKNLKDGSEWMGASYTWIVLYILGSALLISVVAFLLKALPRFLDKEPSAGQPAATKDVEG